MPAGCWATCSDLRESDDADSQLRALPVRKQRIVEAAVTARLREQPAIPTKAIRHLRPNPLAEFELRFRDLRVLYNVEQENSEVVLLIVGRKVGTKLIVGGKESMDIEAIPLLHERVQSGSVAPAMTTEKARREQSISANAGRSPKSADLARFSGGRYKVCPACVNASFGPHSAMRRVEP